MGDLELRARVLRVLNPPCGPKPRRSLADLRARFGPGVDAVLATVPEAHVDPAGRVRFDRHPPARRRPLSLARRALRALERGDDAGARAALLGALGALPGRPHGAPLDAAGILEAVVLGAEVRRG